MNNVMERVKAFFGHPSLRLMVAKDLDDARKDLLAAQTDKDYAEAADNKFMTTRSCLVVVWSLNDCFITFRRTTNEKCTSRTSR